MYATVTTHVRNENTGGWEAIEVERWTPGADPVATAQREGDLADVSAQDIDGHVGQELLIEWELDHEVIHSVEIVAS